MHSNSTGTPNNMRAGLSRICVKKRGGAQSHVHKGGGAQDWIEGAGLSWLPDYQTRCGKVVSIDNSFSHSYRNTNCKTVILMKLEVFSLWPFVLLCMWRERERERREKINLIQRSPDQTHSVMWGSHQLSSEKQMYRQNWQQHMQSLAQPKQRPQTIQNNKSPITLRGPELEGLYHAREGTSLEKNRGAGNWSTINFCNS